VTASENFAAESENLQGIVERADRIAANVETFSGHLPALGENSDALIAAINPEELAATLERINTLVAAIEPEEVRTTVSGFSSLAETLQAQQTNIDTIITQATSVAGDLSAFAASLPAMGERTDALLTAIDPETLGRTLANIDQFSTTLAENTDDIDVIVADARGLAERFDTIGGDVEELLAKLNSMAGEGTGGLTADLQETLAAVRDAANAFNAEVTVVGGSVGDFSDRGLRDFQNLISEGQRTISRLDGVLDTLQQNPSGFIFGGERVPEYGGLRH
jgi:phospholipid/cholesterol/gamma-HCH transport system substrate-binding protein